MTTRTAVDSFTQIATVRIDLKDSDPPIWRMVEVPTSITLKVLHDIVQVTMGWFDYHLWEMVIGGQTYGLPMDEDWGTAPRKVASRTRLRDVLAPSTTTIDYIYDFGDNWHHVIKVEKIDDAIPGGEYPRLVRAIGACPPEDVGGGPGYADFLEAMADPNHEEHARMLEWHGGKFDPDEAEIGRILVNFERLAKKWGPKPRKPKAV